MCLHDNTPVVVALPQTTGDVFRAEDTTPTLANFFFPAAELDDEDTRVVRVQRRNEVVPKLAVRYAEQG